jgi:phosphoserine phosphatase RsbU/P
MISLKPAIAIMNNLKYPQKFLLISTVFCLPMVLMMYLLITEINTRVEFANKEIIDNQYLRSLNQLWKNTLQGKVVIQDQSSNFNPLQIQQSLENLESTNQDLGTQLQTSEIYTVLKARTQSLSKIDNSQNTFIYEAIINDIKNLRAQVGDTSNLILDPDLDTYYLMDATLIRLPDLQELLSEIQLVKVKIKNREQISNLDRSRLIQLSALLRD